MWCQITVAILKMSMSGTLTMIEEKNADEMQKQTIEEAILKDGAVMLLMIASAILTITEGRRGAMTGDVNMTGTETETAKKATTKDGEGTNTGGRITNTTGEKVVLRATEMRAAGEMILRMTMIAVRGRNKKIIKGMIEEMTGGMTEEGIQEVIGERMIEGMIEEMIEGVIEELMSNQMIRELTIVVGLDRRRWWGTSEHGEVQLMPRLSHHGKRM